jgi:hypothetical protein
MTSGDYTLDRLIDPVSAPIFFEEHWERRPLVVTRDAPNYYSSLVTMDEVEAVINETGLRYPDLNMANADDELAKDDYAKSTNLIDRVRVYKLFAEGSTIILPHLHLRHNKLAAFCRGMEARFSAPFQTNLYLSPQNGQGFIPHFDNHDVFVLQVAGSKQWTIYDAYMDLPLRGQVFDKDEHKPGLPTQEFELKAGDLVYVPRGVMHSARSTDELSLHVTVGALVYSWADLLLEAMSAHSLESRSFREALPIGYAAHGFDSADAAKRFRQLASDFAAHGDFEAAIEKLVDRFRDSRAPLLDGQLDQTVSLAALILHDVVAVRPHAIFEVTNKDDSVHIDFAGADISIPGFATTAVHRILSGEPVRIADLPSELDDEGKLTLVRRLIKEGLVRVITE